MSRHVIVASAVGLFSAILASDPSTNSYQLIAIAPRFLDETCPVTWSFLLSRVAKYALANCLFPLVVLVTFLLAQPFTQFAYVVALAAGVFLAPPLTNLILVPDMRLLEFPCAAWSTPANSKRIPRTTALLRQGLCQLDGRNMFLGRHYGPGSLSCRAFVVCRHDWLRKNYAGVVVHS